MPYTPTNHPYIPGDPYSYDLKWLVGSQKESVSKADLAATQAAQAISDAASALTAAGAAATAAANASNSAAQASAQAASANAAATQAAADAAAAREAAEGAAYDYWRIVVDYNGSVSFGSEPVLSYLWDALQAGKAGFEIQDSELDPLRNFYIEPDPNNRVTVDRYRGKLRYWAYISGNIIFCNIAFEMTKSGDDYSITFQDRTACYITTTPGIPSDEEESEAL